MSKTLKNIIFLIIVAMNLNCNSSITGFEFIEISCTPGLCNNGFISINLLNNGNINTYYTCKSTNYYQEKTISSKQIDTINNFINSLLNNLKLDTNIDFIQPSCYDGDTYKMVIQKKNIKYKIFVYDCGNYNIITNQTYKIKSYLINLISDKILLLRKNDNYTSDFIKKSESYDSRLFPPRREAPVSNNNIN